MRIQATPYGPTLVDDNFMPRFWVTVWSLLKASDLAPSTLRQKLTHINALYVHTDELGGNRGLLPVSQTPC